MADSTDSISKFRELSGELEVFWNVTRSIAETAKKLEEPFRQEQLRQKTTELELGTAQRKLEQALARIQQLESALRGEQVLKKELSARIETEAQARKQAHALFDQEKKRTNELHLKITELEKELKAHQVYLRDKNVEITNLKNVIPKRDETQKRLEARLAELERRRHELEQALKVKTESETNYKTVLFQVETLKKAIREAESEKAETEKLFLTAKKNVEKLLLDRQMILKQLSGLRAKSEQIKAEQHKETLMKDAAASSSAIAKPARRSALFKGKTSSATPPPFRKSPVST